MSSNGGRALSLHQSSGSVAQMVPQRLFPSLIDLEHLSPEEQSIILSVLDRDEQLRSYEQDRVKKLKGELHELRKKSAAKAADENDNNRVCVRCRESLGRLFKTGDNCPKCQHRVCKNCQVTLPSGTRWLCTVCHKAMQLQLETGEWYYKKLQIDEVPLLGSDLVKASLAKAKHSLTDPTTAPVLTASDLRSKTTSSRGKGSRGHKQRGRMNSRSSSDYGSSTTRESSQPSVRYENSSSDPNSPIIHVHVSHTTSSSRVGKQSEVNSDPEDHPRGRSGIKWKKAAVVNQAGNRLHKLKGNRKTNALKPGTHVRSHSSGSERFSAADSSEVDTVIEPISGFAFQRVSFRKDRGNSDNASSDSTDPAYQLRESISSERSISDSGLEDSLCSGQTGGSSPPDSTNPSPTDFLPVTSDPYICHPYGGNQAPHIEMGRSNLRSDFDFPRPVYVRSDTDMTADTISRTSSTPVGFLIIAEPITLDKASNPDHLSGMNANTKNLQNPDDIYMYSGNQQTQVLQPINNQDDNCKVENHLYIDGQRQTPLKVDNSRTLLKISPNGAFSILSNNFTSPEVSFESESEATGLFKPIKKSYSIDVAHSLNSMYIDSEQSLLKPKEGLNLNGSYFNEIERDLNAKKEEDNEMNSSVSESRVESTLSSYENCQSSRISSELEKKHLQRSTNSMDDSSSDSVCTPSDESDSLCELELDWDLRSSSPDFQEVQLQTKLKKNQLLMNELMKEAHRVTPDIFHQSVSSDDDIIPIQKESQPEAESMLKCKKPENEFPLQTYSLDEVNVGDRRKHERECETVISHGDSDLSSSVSSWVDSDPSSDDNTSVIPTPLAMKSSINVAGKNSGQATNQKTVIPRPNWAEMKAQQWKAAGPVKSFRVKQAGGRREAASQPKVISDGPVLITEKNKGMYVVNPGLDNTDSESDTSSDDSDHDSQRKPFRPHKLSARPRHLQLSYCSSSDSELSTILEVSEEDLSSISLENSPLKTTVFNITLTHGIPSIVVSEQHPCMSSTEEDADDEADDNPQYLTPTFEPRVGWPDDKPQLSDNSLVSAEAKVSGRVLDWCLGQTAIADKPVDDGFSKESS